MDNMKWVCKCGNDDRDGGRVTSKGIFICKKCLEGLDSIIKELKENDENE